VKGVIWGGKIPSNPNVISTHLSNLRTKEDKELSTLLLRSKCPQLTDYIGRHLQCGLRIHKIDIMERIFLGV
jgi:hypothetical protein